MAGTREETQEQALVIGMEHPGAAASGVLEAEAEAILNNLARIGLLIYSLELEE